MAAKSASDDWLFATRWVHVFEEDTPEGAVYRPEDSNIPLSRRPRERLELARDGSASLFVGGPDDRLVEQPATWRDEAGGVAIRPRDGAEVLVVDRSPERIVVQTRSTGRAR